ncbi:C-X-C chemokine receptor type 2-like isoform X1 [Chaetodon auriga]|uniref:C-X-C chemokine receptor type 2-like isoform X1 n=1 Tax=Chaetodon auriga TaxID=39042 RepID=UPI004032CA0F
MFSLLFFCNQMLRHVRIGWTLNSAEQVLIPGKSPPLDTENTITEKTGSSTCSQCPSGIVTSSQDINKYTMALEGDYNGSDYFEDYLYYDNELTWEVKSEPDLYRVVCYVLIFCISMPGNIFLLWTLLRERAWKSTSDILLLQLTVSDLCLSVTLPLWACDHLYGWMFGDWACGALVGASSIGLNSYALILAAMALYHYVAVAHASRLSAQSPQKFCVLMASSVIWLVCVAEGIRVFMNSEAVEAYGHITCLHAPQSLAVLLFDICMQIGLCCLVPSIIITFCCVHTWITLKQRRMNRHHQASRLMLGMIVVFFLCFVPYNIIVFTESLAVIYALEYAAFWRQAMYYAEVIIYTLPYFHCCLNPLLHIFGAQRFRRHLPVPCSTSSQRRDGCHNLSSEAIIAPHDGPV